MTESGTPRKLAGDALVQATPLAVELAKALKVDLSTLRPATGEGPITELDVRDAVRAIAEAARVPEPAESIRLPAPLRDLSESAAPLLTITASASVDPVATSRQDPAAELIDLVLYAVIQGLARQPRLNARLADGEIQVFKKVNLGFSVAFADAMVFPVLREVEQASRAQVAQERRRLTMRTSADDLQPWEIEGGTFTVSDLGPLGVGDFTRPPVFPQVAILCLGQVAERPVIIDGSVTARAELPLSLSVDVRAVDELIAAAFLRDLAAAIEG